MRYEDASHTGAFQGQGPIANDDLEVVAAGAKSSATGNIITGEGTQSGTAGADSATDGHITAIAGKGGEDSSFSGGKLSVMGEYGKLSVDAEGNYVYQVNKGVENVRDRFTYTLADNNGASDTAALIIEIGKTPFAVKADAQQVVVGPDGVVTLPAGVELSDVHVVGRNLVVDMPDGTQLIIIDGAVFVPQLVLGGVEVPATNVAALLIGQEIQPAAGETPPSSGGNFGVPPPPLDPGVPLGDLIPPTEYNYHPPEPQPTNDILDREPEAGSASAILDDDAQAGGIAGGVGDDPGSNFASGNLPGSGGDGTLEWDLLASGTLPAGFSFSLQGNGDLWVMQGATHVLTITVDPTDGDYTVTQVAPIDHPAGGDENNLDFVINYSVTDDDGDVAIGTLNINVDDDTPTVDVSVASDANVVLLTQDAETDGDPTDTDTDSTTADFGGIFSHSSAFGADGAGTANFSYALSTIGGASGLSQHGDPINLYLIGGVVVGSTAATAGAVDAGNTVFDISVDSNTGVVTVNQYSQIDHTNTDPSPTGPGYEDHLISLADGAVTLTQTGTVTDGDGDTVTDSASVGIGANIQFADDGPSIDPTLNEVGAAIVDESAPVDTATIPLTAGYTRGDDPDLSGGLAIGKGSTSGPVIDANAAFGADGPASGGGISYDLEVGNAVSGLTTTDGTAINLVELSNGVVVGVVDGTTTVAFAISIDSGTGVVTVEQYLSLFHPDSPSNFDEPVFLDEGSLGVTVTASDFDGDSVTSDAVDITSLIRFEDDGPSVDPTLNANATVTVDESLPSNTPGIDTGGIAKGDDPDLAGGLAIGQGNSGVAIVDPHAVFGADGPAADDSILYSLSITNADPGVTLTDGTTITLQLVNGVIVGVVDSGPFDGEAAFAIAINPTTGVVTVEQYLSLDHPVNPDPNDPLGLGDNSVAVNVTATDGDGDQITSGDIDISGQITFLDDGPSVAPTVNAEATVTVDESLPSNTPGIDTGGIVKGDDPDLAGGLAIGQGTSGSAVVDPHAVFGADGPAGEGGISYALSILNLSSGLTLTDGTPIDLQLVGGVIVGVVDGGTFDGQAAFAIAIDSSTGVVTVEQYLSLDHPINPNPNDPLGLDDNTVGVTVTATDGDGDPVTSDAVDISHQITFLDDGPTVDPTLDAEATVTVDESLPSNVPGINTGGIAKGDDPDLAGGQAIGQANSGGAIVDANAVFGADGPAAGGGISYALVLGANDTPLTLTDGSTITLQLVGGVIVGVVDNGPFAGQAAFALAINSTTGVVSVEQYLSLDHPVNPDPNDPLGIGDDTVGVTVTATDGDGDPVTSNAVDISDNITFLDDGPTVDPTLNVNATVTVDESLPSNTPGINTGGIVKGDDPDLAGGIAIGQANSGSAIVDPHAVFGADGPAVSGSISYALSIQDVSSGLTLTDGTPIDLQLVNGVIVGVVNGGTFDGQAAFAIAINSSTGVVTVEQYLSLDHPLNPNPNDPLSFGEDVIGVTVTATDGDGDPVTSGAVDIGGQITFLDDGPSANNDTDTTDPITDQAVGNVITGSGTNEGTGNHDVPGADGYGSISNLVGFNGSTDNNPAGGFDVTGEFGTLHMDANGTYTYTRTSGAGGDTDTFTYTYVDGDGDPATATLVITIADETPNLPDPDVIHLDDDVIPGANGNVPDGPGDDDPDVVGQNVVNGQLNGTGGNAPLTYNFTGDDTLPAGFSIGAGSDADTLIIVQDQNGSPVTVMTIQLDQSDGSFTVTQNNPVWHPADNGGPDDNIENNLNLSIGVEVEDADHDVEPAHITINVDDDTPTIDVTKGSDSGVNLTTDDAQTIGGASDTASTSANFGGVFGLTQSAGADGTNAAATLQYALGVSSQGVNSGLESHNADIFLYVIGGTVVGSTSATEGGVNLGNTIFDVTVNGSGVVTLTQYQQIDHDTADPTPTGSPFADHIVSLTDSLITLTASASLADKDGDTVTDSETVDIGANLHFTDDGPSSAISIAGVSMSIDESAGNQGDSNDVTGPLAQFAGVSNPGDDPDVVGTVIQYAVGAGAVSSSGSAYGADGAGSTVFSLSVASAGVDSGLNTTDGHDILLYKEGNLVIGRVSGGADDGKAAFAVAIDSATGQLSMVEYLSIQHPNPANPDDSVSINQTAVSAVVTVTDFDGDTSSTSAAIGNLISFQDSGPIMTAAQNMNIQNSGDVAHTAAFAFNLGADGPNIATNDVITNVTGSATVGGVAVTNWILTPGVENGTTASYSFSFDYPIGGGATAHETGTLVFDKVAGTYTVDLADPIQGVTTILQTATGTLFQGYEFGSSTLDGSQPAISVTQIQDLAGTANDIYVQFTSVSEPSSGTGDNNLEFSNWVPGSDNPAPVNGGGDTTWNAGQLFNQVDGWVSTSNDSNGVDGDTIQGGEVLDFTLVQGANPTGVLANPANYAQASSMFLKFDGIGSAEDMIVVLKLYDPNTNTYTTRAVMIENADIFKGPGSGPGSYSSISLDNNDGLVIIESNDYNLPGEHWVIVGAQVAGSDEGLTGTAINLNGAIGAAGDSITGGAFDTQSFATDVNDGPFKISSIGFTTVSTTPQNAQLDFNVTVTDGDGDSITQAISATVTPAVDSVSAATIPAANTTIAPVVLDLNGDGVQFLAADAGVRYDYNGDGVKEATAWAGPTDGILVHDVNGNGTVDGASEFVFGSGSVTDLQGLRALYGDTLDANDADFSKFGVWQDANSNGVVDAGEYQSLTAAGITSINLVSDGVTYSAAGGDVVVAGSSTYTNSDGSTGTVADASFYVGRSFDDEKSLSSSTSNIALAAAVAAAGLAASQPAAASVPDEASHGQTVADTASSVGPAVVAAADDASESRSALSNETKEAADDVVQAASSGHSDQAADSNHSLDNSSASEASSSAPAAANDDQGPAADAPAASPVAPAVAMASAEALQAAGLDGNAQHGGSVEKIVAEALGAGNGHGAAIDAILDAFHGGNGGGQAIANLASAGANAVSAWDMASNGGSTGNYEMLMKVGAEMLHHDMVQPTHNG